MPYNIISCAGFASQGTGFLASLSCIKARLGLVFLFFIIALIRKWGGEEAGIGFSFLFSLLFGISSYLIIVTIFGSFKIAMLVGLALAVVGGYGAGIWFGGEE